MYNTIKRKAQLERLIPPKVFFQIFPDNGEHLLPPDLLRTFNGMKSLETILWSHSPQRNGIYSKASGWQESLRTEKPAKWLKLPFWGGWYEITFQAPGYPKKFTNPNVYVWGNCLNKFGISIKVNISWERTRKSISVDMKWSPRHIQWKKKFNEKNTKIHSKWTTDLNVFLKLQT